MARFVVIGAGLAGSLVTRVLRKAGHTVTVIDDRDNFSASQASSNLYIASWLKKFSNKGAKRGIEVLESLNLPTEQVFESGIADAMKVRHIAQRNVLVEPDHIAKVTQLHRACVWAVEGSGPSQSEERFEGFPVVCTGYRGAELIPELAGRIEAKVGHAMLIKGQLRPGESALRIVSPYTHGKLYQFDPGHIYFADSVALKPKSYWDRQQDLKMRTMSRCLDFMGREFHVKEWRVGYRPIIRGHDFGIVGQSQNGAFYINGGGKNGMVAYCNAAEQLRGMIGA